MRSALFFRLSARRPGLALALLWLVMVTGCAVGPDYHAPAKPSENAYEIKTKTAGDTAEKASDTNRPIPKQVFARAHKVRADWYHLFGSAKLDALIGRAIDNSPTLAAGQARIRAAREAVKASEGALYPHLSANASYARTRANGTQLGIAQAQFINVFNLYQGGVSAGYDLDLFGKTRRRIERSSAQLDEQRYNVLDTYVTLINNIVATAIAEAGDDAAIQTTLQIAAAQKKSLSIVKKQIKYGAAIQSDATQIRTQLARTRASLEPLRKQHTLAVDRLAVLVGAPPGIFNDPRFTLGQLKLPRKLPASVPSQLVNNRPDILAAASALHAASAQVGVATANLLPDISLGASYTRTGLTPSDLADPALAIYSLGAQLAAPIFEGGRLRAEKHRAQDLYTAALADYRATVLSAFGEVANSLRSIESDARALKAQRAALNAARDNLDTVRTQLRNGAADYVNLYTAQSQFQSARLAFTNARVTRYSDTADLFRALGGGWSENGGAPLVDANTATDLKSSQHAEAR